MFLIFFQQHIKFIKQGGKSLAELHFPELNFIFTCVARNAVAVRSIDRRRKLYLCRFPLAVVPPVTIVISTFSTLPRYSLLIHFVQCSRILLSKSL